jgi:TRAP transporter TAXI family solute receptor
MTPIIFSQLTSLEKFFKVSDEGSHPLPLELKKGGLPMNLNGVGKSSSCFQKTMIFLFAFVLVVGFAATSHAAQKRYTVAGATPGSTTYVSASAFADYITKNSKKLALTAQTTKGFVENIRLIDSGETELGFSAATNIYPALRGMPPFKEGKKKNLRGIINGGTSVISLVTLKSRGIKSIKDLAGKRVNFGPPGSNAAFCAGLTLKAHGILDKVSKSQLGYNDAGAALRDGKIDAYCVTGDYPGPVIIETFASMPNDAMILPFSDEMAKKISGEYPPLTPTEIPAKVYQGQTQPIPVLGYRSFLMAHPQVPDWVPYEILSIMLKPAAKDKLIQMAVKWEGLKDKDEAHLGDMAAIGLQIHPGAIKFWKERGYKIPTVKSP